MYDSRENGLQGQCNIYATTYDEKMSSNANYAREKPIAKANTKVAGRKGQRRHSVNKFIAGEDLLSPSTTSQRTTDQSVSWQYKVQ